MVKKKNAEQVRQRFIKAMDHILKEGIAKDTIEFATKIGVYQQNLSKIKAKERYPTLDAVVSMCQEYKINPNWLLLGSGEMGAVEVPLTANALQRLNNLEKIVKDLNGKRLKKSA